MSRPKAKKIKHFLWLIFILLILNIFSACLIVRGNVQAKSEQKIHQPQEEKVRVMITIQVENPDLIVIPTTYVYWYDAGDSDVYFYGGLWWRYWEGNWYRASNHRGNWIRVEVKAVPFAVLHLPPNWKVRRYKAVKVSYYEVRENWNSWEKNKYWDKRGWE